MPNQPDRMVDLLNKAADYMEEGNDPFHISFLSEHDVTLDEVFAMASLLALGARMIVWSIENPKAALASTNAATLSMITDLLVEVNKRASN